MKSLKLYLWYINVKWSFILLRDLGTKKIGAEVFGEPWNVIVQENGEDQMAMDTVQDELKYKR